jgi:chromosome segregation ATPase
MLARMKRERRYVRYIKDQAKSMKKKKREKKLGKAATRIQKRIRGGYIRQKYGKVLEKAKERSRLKEKIEKIKKKTAKTEKTRKKELDYARNGIDTERDGRDAWEATVLAASEEAVQSETAKMVEYLQGEHRKLQIRSKTFDGMIKPLTKNFETLMEENQELRDEFAGIHKKNEAMKASNTELVDRRSAAEKKTKELKEELKSVSLKFMPVAHGRLDFQKALKEVLEMLEKRCKDGQLIEDVTLIAFQCQADAKRLQAGADAANDVEFSPRQTKRKTLGGSFSSKTTRKTLGGSFSNISTPKTPLSVQAGTKSRRSAVRGSLAGIDSIGSPGLMGKGGSSSFNVGSKNKLPPLLKKKKK